MRLIGLGKRMQPITLRTPKPLIQIGNKNLLDRAIELLINHGVDRLLAHDVVVHNLELGGNLNRAVAVD